MVALNLTPRDDTSKEYDLLDWFDDPNDVFLDYDAKADMVAKAWQDTPVSQPRPVVAKDGEAIVTATIDGNKLTIALTAKAINADETDVWVFAEDGNGEYARKRVHVTVGTSTNPYVMTALADVTLREDDAENTTIDAGCGFR